MRRLDGGGGGGVVPGSPACVTVTAWPATVSVPTRCVAAPLAVTLKVTELIPTPAPGFVMVIQVSAVDAPQVHWVPAVTLSVRLVLNASIAKLVGDTE